MIRLKGILALHILLFLACAVQRAPPGGPVDTTPPGVIRTIPVSGETNVNPDTRVEVMFSEGLIPVTSTEAVYISPFPGDGVKYQWRGKKLSIKFPEPLQPDRTYVISLGTGIKDYRNNAMDSTFTLAFSTGDELDKGEISGQLYMDSDAKGIDVWAYRMGEEHEPNPMIRTPDYIVQCESNGAFRFTYLTQGHYRIFVIRDYVSDRLYQPMEDEIGICYRDVILSAENAFKDDGLVFRIIREDTLGPSLSRARSLNRTHVVVQFDEYVRQPDSLSASFRIMNTDSTNREIDIHYIYQDPLNERVFHWYTDTLSEGLLYKAHAEGIFDKNGNAMDAKYSSAEFEGTGLPDTLRPVLLHIDPAPYAKMVELRKAIRLIFNEAMDTTAFASGFTVSDTMGHDVIGAFTWPNPAEMIFLPESNWKRETIYQVTLSDTGVKDLSGRGLVDTVFQFHTLNPDTLSEISGRVLDLDSTAQGNIFLTVIQTRTAEISYNQMIKQPGPFRFKSILPGQYQLQVFRDQDGNGRYSYGKAVPFHSAERFVVYPDTLEVRSRWPNEGNNLSLP